MIKTAAELLQVAALRTRTVKVRDAEVRIRELSVRARQELLGLPNEQAAVWLVQHAVVDENGDPVFKQEDAALLAASSTEVVDAIAGAVMDLSGLIGKKKN